MLPDAMNTFIRPLFVARIGLAGALFSAGCGKPTPPPQGGGDFPIMATAGYFYSTQFVSGDRSFGWIGITPIHSGCRFTDDRQCRFGNRR